MKTINPKKESLKVKWVLIDAKDQVLGRIASKIAILLQGKDTPQYAPYLPGTTCVVVINSQEINLTGRKKKNKTYWHHTGYPGGIKSITYQEILKKKPDFPLKHAVKGMLPKNTLGKYLLTRLKIYPSSMHPHEAQEPSLLKV